MKLKLGRLYLTEVRTQYDGIIFGVCKFIKVTKKGYNMLNIKTSKCIFRNHMYPIKGTKMDFFIYKKIKIKSI